MQNGLSGERVQLIEPALLHEVTRYTREAGVRALQPAIGGVMRFRSVEWRGSHTLIPGDCLHRHGRLHLMCRTPTAQIQSIRNGDSGYDAVVEAGQLKKILGPTWGCRDMVVRAVSAGRDVAWSGLVLLAWRR